MTDNLSQLLAAPLQAVQQAVAAEAARSA